MSDVVKHVIYQVLFNKSCDVDILDSDIELLNTLPVDSVVSILRDVYDNESDVYVRARAFSAIMSISKFDKVYFLMDILEKTPTTRHYNACYELRYFQDYRAMIKLCNILLINPDPNLRYIAAESLANFDDATVIQALETARDHDTGENFEGFPVSEMAEWALKKIHNRMNQ